MKHTTILICAMVIMAACKKEAGPGAGTSKLTGVYTDTSGQRWNFIYTGGKITSISDSSAGTANTFINFQYSGDYYIKATPINPQGSMGWGIDSIEYFLTNSKLPLRILTHFNNGWGNFETDFFYKQGTNLLDSVNDVCSNSNTYWYPRPEHYTFGYQAGDITSVNLTLFDGFKPVTYTAWFSYAYDTNTPNIFRNTDSLLYIYQYPFPYIVGSYEEVLFFFPEVFSASTFITANIGYNGWPPFNFPFTLTNDKKVKSDLFYTYFYQ